jgi:hypothetical protein
MVPMYLGRWIAFYMDINDQLFAVINFSAGTKLKKKPIVKKS